ncbi:hypothetical protein GCM10011504_47840 [Siccirubricoccus deserti]|nr:hypothetical protein GCM10011504_47840 [Siccirubricoccus deserti]
MLNPTLAPGSDPILAFETTIAHLARGLCRLDIWCRACDRRASISAVSLARRYERLTCYEASLRMRCTACGIRGWPIRVTVEGMGPDAPVRQRGLL